MAGSMLDALKKANLEDRAKAEAQEKKDRCAMREREDGVRALGGFRVFDDEERARQDEAHLQRAIRESSKSSSRVGTKQYFDRFRK